MGTTTNYALPYPDASASVDVPRDVKNLADASDALLKSKFVTFAPNGAVVITSGGVARNLPFAVMNGYNNTWFDNVAFATVVVTFAVSRFTTVPTLHVTSDDPNIHAIARFAMTSSFSLQMLNLSGASITGNRYANWLAMQTLPTGLGRDVVVPQEATLMTATCHTSGCDNAEHPIGCYMEGALSPVVCGVCGQPIADVVVATS